MYSNHPAVQAFLEQGGTLVVPTRQRAAAVQLAYTAAQLARGAETWDSPDVIHWSAWQGRRLGLLRQPEAGARRQLSAVEEWFLWREALNEATSEEHGALLQADGLVDELQRADALIDAWGLQGGAGPGAEGALLLRLRRHMARRREALGIVDRPLWRSVDEDAGGALWLLGFDDIGRADRQALQSLGAQVATPRGTAISARELAAAHPEEEAALVAAWCRHRLARDPDSRLLVVAPRLRQYEEPLRRHLAEQLDGDAIQSGDADVSRFVVEGGLPLQDFPLVAAARGWLRAVSGRSDFGDWSALLRSPYLDLGGLPARIGLELWLREHHVTAIEPGDGRRLAARLVQQLTDRVTPGADPDAPLKTLMQRPLQVLDSLQNDGPVLDTPAGWARRWARWLETAGWPGTQPLGSREQQVRQRFETLLGEFAWLGELSAPLGAGAALQYFQDWLRRASFEPASGDVPVTVTDDIGDPLVRYDGIWVCGLTAQDWPPPSHSNAFVSLPGLLAAGWDAGTAAGALRRAEAAMSAWSARTGELVYSWPQQQGDAVLLRSPLLGAGAPINAGADGMPLPESPWRNGAFAAFETYGLRPPLPWPAGARARGGVRLLEHQATCPFRGFAHGRLQGDALELPQPGVPASLHGIVMHGALQRLWSELLDSAGLQAALPSLATRIESAVAGALRRAQSDCVALLPPALWHIEARRCARLIDTLLRQEAQREPFTVVATEKAVDWQHAGVALRLRVDRLDRLADGTHALIDYKTGRRRRFDVTAERPEAPQLLAYATVLDEPLSALASVHVHVEGVHWVGVADRDGRLPEVTATATPDDDWPGLRARWSAQIRTLMEEFAQGMAGVRPQPRACDRCHLQGLCRIDARAVPLVDDDAAEVA